MSSKPERDTQGPESHTETFLVIGGVFDRFSMSGSAVLGSWF
jgi:hypothetical protein